MKSSNPMVNWKASVRAYSKKVDKLDKALIVLNNLNNAIQNWRSICADLVSFSREGYRINEELNSEKHKLTSAATDPARRAHQYRIAKLKANMAELSRLWRIKAIRFKKARKNYINYSDKLKALRYS